jgi:hypothetical protein
MTRIGQIHTDKAESLVINSIGQRPMKRNAHDRKAPTGRNNDVALAGLGFAPHSPHTGRCPALLMMPFQGKNLRKSFKSALSACQSKIKNQNQIF